MPPINLFVNTTTDENDGSPNGQGLSLRDAILTANADTANEYVIVLQGGSTYTLSLNNNSGDEEGGLTGDLDITGGARISIVTSDASKAIINAAGITSGDRAFDVLANARLTLNNVEITGGSTQESGGAISIAKDASVVIEESIIKDNAAAVDGGAIYNKGNLSITESSIKDNKALVGAGIANYNSAVISKSSITGNNGISGGAIYNRDSLTLSESNISGNTATFGGAVYNSGDNLNITLSNISDNNATVAGGAIYSNGSAEIEQSNIANNISGENGGGIINLESGNLALISTNVSGNSSKTGGGVDNLGTVNLVSSTLNNNTAENGGGMSNSGDYAKATLVNATVSGNNATVNGGGIANEAQLNIINATIVQNTSDSNGGGIFNAVGASATLKNTIVAQNAGNDLFGLFKGNANNIIGNTAGATGTIATGSDMINGNPFIGPLQDNGFGVLTHVLLAGSGAIDKGNNSYLPKDIFDLDGDGNVGEPIPFDGKGGDRIVNGKVDIGAIEFMPEPQQDTPGINITSNGILFTNENGTTAQFTIVLNSQPTSNVTIPLSSSDTTEGTLSTSSITFTPANWNVAQTVMVTGVDDEIIDGSVPYTIVTAAAVSTDANYSGLNADDVNAVNNDNEIAGITLSQTSGLVTNENGATAQFTIVLNNQPTSDVTIALNSSDTTEGTLSTSSITFTPANWNIAQTVMVTGVDDAIIDGSVPYTIVTAAAVSTDANYNGLDTDDVSAVNNDNEIAGITLSQTSGLVTNENGATAQFTIVLNNQPTSDVTIALSSSDTTEGMIFSASSIVFTSENWNVAQTVMVTGVDDAIADGSVPYTIVTAAAVSDDTAYSGLDADDVSAMNEDNDRADITINPASGLFTNENGATAQFTVVLNSQPTSDVTIALSSSDTAEGTISTSSITFTPDNWNVAQTATVTGVDDEIIDGSVPYTIVTAAAVSADANYNGLDANDVRVTNNDNETAGITVSQTNGLVTDENGATAQFSVVLNKQPTSDVTIALSSSNTAEGTISTSSITFTTDNWNVAQTVTATGADDAIADGSVSYTIVTAEAVSDDSNYNGLDADDVSVINEDNDRAGVTLSQASDLVTSENGATAQFAVVLNSQPTSDVTIELRSNDTTEGTVSTSSIIFTPANWNVAQTVMVEGINDRLIDGDIPYTIVTAETVSEDSNYNGLNVADVNLVNNDNDGAPIAVEAPTIPADKPGVVAFDKLPDLDFSTFNPFGSPSEDETESEPAFSIARIGDLPSNAGLRAVAAANGSESIQGSFVTDSTTDNLTFAKTGAPMGSGIYQMTLKTDGMLDEDGNPIDGDGDGNPGGDFVLEFPVDNRGKRTFRLDDFVAGPGQSVKLPNSGDRGIDINLDDATGITKVEFDFVFDEDILGVSGVSRGANLPSSWSISSEIEAPGRLQVILSGTEAIQGGVAQLINVVADVLPTAVYGSSELLQLDKIELNDGMIGSIGDVGVHHVGKLGDLSGNDEYTSLDAALLSRVVQGIDRGFSATPLIDGNILGDINSNNSLTADDVMSIAKKAVGLPQSDII